MDTHRPAVPDSWASGDLYDSYVGRWSRLLAQQFLTWLAVPPGRRWLDVGCGTGALSQTILNAAQPEAVKGVDRSEGFIAYARRQVADPRLSFEMGDATALPMGDGEYDVVVSGLMLNFVDRPEKAAAEMVRAARPGGCIAAYVWDYAIKMQFMRHFWNAAAALDPAARDLDEGLRFPLCNPGPLADLFRSTGLREVEVHAIDIGTDFRDFDDFWLPFLSGQGPAPGYTMSLSEARRAALRERLRDSLPVALDGSIPLVARAWAASGKKG